MPKKSIIEAIFLIRQHMERYRERKKDLNIVIIDMGKAYVKVYKCHVVGLAKAQSFNKVITLIKDTFDNVVTSVQTSDGDTYGFPINIGLHQGSALSRYLFTLGWMRSQETYKVISLGACSL
jgi:hypothetical protein